MKPIVLLLSNLGSQNHLCRMMIKLVFRFELIFWYFKLDECLVLENLNKVPVVHLVVSSDYGLVRLVFWVPTKM